MLWITRKFEEAFFYFPFLMFALVLRLPFRLSCRKCGKSLFFDWTATRLGACRNCCLEDHKILQQYWVRPSGAIYSKVSPLVGEGLILDAGCGVGYLFEKLRDGERELIGIDLDVKSIEHFHSRYPKATLVLGDVACLPLKDNTFDGLVSVEVLEHIKEIRSPLREYYRVLKPEGRLLVTVPNGSGVSKDAPGHIHFLSFKQFVRLVEQAGFEVCHTEKFGVAFPIISYLATAISSRMGKCLPLANPVNLRVPEVLSTNFLIVAKKPLLSSGMITNEY